jgi:protein-S-isoprenylcysteine O-methyltransferase Ste14
MRATSWEFKYRALIFGLIFGAGFAAYTLDRHNSAAALSGAAGAMWGIESNLIIRVLFGLAALLVIAAALVRTWASSYLQASVVYAAKIKTESLVGDGPYRHVRNPLYLGNMLLVIGLAAFMNWAGAVVAVAAMLIFCYRLIQREESELEATQGERYERYRSAVPCLWPALRPRVASGGRHPNWLEGFKAEFWMWGYGAATVVLAATLNARLFFVILGASIGLVWLTSWLLGSRRGSSR